MFDEVFFVIAIIYCVSDNVVATAKGVFADDEKLKVRKFSFKRALESSLCSYFAHKLMMAIIICLKN